MNNLKKKKFIIFNTNSTLKTSFNFVNYISKIKIKASHVLGNIGTQEVDLKTDNNQYLIIDLDSSEETELDLVLYGTANNYGVCIVEFEEIEKQDRKHNFKMYNFKKNKRLLKGN